MALETITLTDAASGRTPRSSARGFNCYSFETATPTGKLETLWAVPDFATGGGKPSGSGIPLMFPFAGRIRGTSFDFEGKSYVLEAGDGLGNAIHGFVMSRPWRVTEQKADRVVGQFQASVDDASLLRHWPADFRITAEYRVTGNSLVSEFAIENPDTKPLPFGFGTHGYFRLPLGGARRRGLRGDRAGRVELGADRAAADRQEDVAGGRRATRAWDESQRDEARPRLRSVAPRQPPRDGNGPGSAVAK